MMMVKEKGSVVFRKGTVGHSLPSSANDTHYPSWKGEEGRNYIAASQHMCPSRNTPALSFAALSFITYVPAKSYN